MKGREIHARDPRVAVDTHWSEDTLGFPPKRLACCALLPRGIKKFDRVNFPLATYSAWWRKNVSERIENLPKKESSGDLPSSNRAVTVRRTKDAPI
jgi:hypothetical protein